MGDNIFNTFSFDVFKQNKKKIKAKEKAKVSKKKKVAELRQKLETRKEEYAKEEAKPNPIEGGDLSEIIAEYERRKQETGADSGSEWEYEEEDVIAPEVHQESDRRLAEPTDKLPPAPVFRYNRLRPLTPLKGVRSDSAPPDARRASTRPALKFNFNRKFPFDNY